MLFLSILIFTFFRPFLCCLYSYFLSCCFLFLFCVYTLSFMAKYGFPFSFSFDFFYFLRKSFGINYNAKLEASTEHCRGFTYLLYWTFHEMPMQGRTSDKLSCSDSGLKLAPVVDALSHLYTVSVVAVLFSILWGRFQPNSWNGGFHTWLTLVEVFTLSFALGLLCIQVSWGFISSPQEEVLPNSLSCTVEVSSYHL